MLDETVSLLNACTFRTTITDHPTGRPLCVIRNDACSDFTAGGAGIWHWDWKPEALAYSSTHRCGLPYVLDHREDCVVVVGFAGSLTLRGSRGVYGWPGPWRRLRATFLSLLIYVCIYLFSDVF